MARREVHQFVETFTAVSQRVRAVAAEAYGNIGLGSAQAKLLRQIGMKGGISQAELARAAGIAPTLTGRGLETLIERGWVRRKRSDDDRRQYLLELTAAGQRARERVEHARDEIVARIETALDARDLADFDRIAKKILAALETASAVDEAE